MPFLAKSAANCGSERVLATYPKFHEANNILSHAHFTQLFWLRMGSGGRCRSRRSEDLPHRRINDLLPHRVSSMASVMNTSLCNLCQPQLTDHAICAACSDAKLLTLLPKSLQGKCWPG
ncbi:unnamed protein product [Effrenium voratum]|nr:unnamed protein product [Effrenium voratum]